MVFSINYMSFINCNLSVFDKPVGIIEFTRYMNSNNRHDLMTSAKILGIPFLSLDLMGRYHHASTVLVYVYVQ